jgi:hypothetical protein
MTAQLYMPQAPPSVLPSFKYRGYKDARVSTLERASDTRLRPAELRSLAQRQKDSGKLEMRSFN